MSHMGLGHNSGSVQVLSDVEVPQKYYNRIMTGVQLLDEIFGGTEMPGIMPGSSVLFTGFPGAGKSTMALQLADLVHRNGGKHVLYNVGEENSAMVKMRADRLGLGAGFCVSHFGDLESLLKYCRAYGVEVLIQDSLQTLECGDLDGAALIKKVGNTLAAFATETDTTVIIVGQITKGGEFAGPMQIKHAVDAHAHLSFNKSTGNRVFELKKNRFGPASVGYEFFMSSGGLDLRQVQEDDGGKKTSRDQKKEAFLDMTKGLLVQGIALNGYSFQEEPKIVEWIAEKFGGDCSGSWWRGVLASAVKELESNGCTFKKFHVNRREFVQLEVA